MAEAASGGRGDDALYDVGANPGRAAHQLAVAELFGAPDPLRVVFTANVTEALTGGALEFESEFSPPTGETTEIG